MINYLIFKDFGKEVIIVEWIKELISKPMVTSSNPSGGKSFFLIVKFIFLIFFLFI